MNGASTSGVDMHYVLVHGKLVRYEADMGSTMCSPELLNDLNSCHRLY